MTSFYKPFEIYCNQFKLGFMASFSALSESLPNRRRNGRFQRRHATLLWLFSENVEMIISADGWRFLELTLLLRICSCCSSGTLFWFDSSVSGKVWKLKESHEDECGSRIMVPRMYDLLR